jgi:hypothetical protein
MDKVQKPISLIDYKCSRNFIAHLSGNVRKYFTPERYLFNKNKEINAIKQQVGNYIYSCRQIVDT